MDLNEYKKRILEARSQEDWDTMLATAQEAMKLYFNDPELQSLLAKTQKLYVKNKMKSDIIAELKKNKDWETLQAVYLRLLAVEPNSKPVRKGLQKVEKEISKAYTQEQKAYFAAAETKVMNLVKEGQHDTALQASYEILSKAPGNPRLQKLLDRVERAREKAMNKEIKAYFKTATPELKQAYRSNKEAFIRI